MGEIREQLTHFFCEYCAPEIMTCRLQYNIESTESDKENVCACQKSSAGPVIDCEKQCLLSGFTLGIKRAPKGSWFCSSCKKNQGTLHDCSIHSELL